MTQRLWAEFLGTFWLTFGGAGSAVLAAVAFAGDDNFPVGIGWVGVALAFGLTVGAVIAGISYKALTGGDVDDAAEGEAKQRAANA